TLGAYLGARPVDREAANGRKLHPSREHRRATWRLDLLFIQASVVRGAWGVRGKAPGAARRQRLAWHSQLRIAGDWRPGQVGVDAQWTEAGVGARQADHGQWAGVVLAVEGCHRRGSPEARASIFRTVEPEAHVERVDRRQADVWIEAEDLIQQDGVDV